MPPAQPTGDAPIIVSTWATAGPSTDPRNLDAVPRSAAYGCRVRRYPDLDPKREADLEALLRELTGPTFHFITDGPQIARWLLAELWAERPPDPSAIAAFLSVMAMATDALRGAASSLARGDFGGLFVEARRAHEMHTLAIACATEPQIAKQWLAGTEVRQIRLRKAIAKSNPEVAESLRESYVFLSNEAHGRSQALSSFADQMERFAWPPHAQDINRSHLMVAHAHLCALVMVHFGLVRWVSRGWVGVSAPLLETVGAFYQAIVAFVHAVHDEGDWWWVPPDHIESWLLSGHGISWEAQRTRDASLPSSRE